MKKLFAAFLLNWEVYATGAAAFALALSLYTGAVWHYARKGVAAKVETKIVTRYVQAAAKETVRRETVVQKVQVRSAADVKKLDRQATRIAALSEESRRASLAHDGDMCLDAASVLRLAAVR